MCYLYKTALKRLRLISISATVSFFRGNDMTALRRFGLLAPLAALSLAGCGLNSVPTAEEQVNAAWGDLQADYQRRADLIPNLVNTVKGYAQQEKSVLVDVTNARAKATSIQLNASDLDDPAKVQAFQDAQSQLGSSLGRLLATSRPIRTSSPTRTSSRCRTSWKAPRTASTRRAATIMRRSRPTTRRIRTFPDAIGAKIFYGAKPKVPFEAAAGAQKAPSVDFKRELG